MNVEKKNWGWGRAIPRKGIYINGIAVAVYLSQPGGLLDRFTHKGNPRFNSESVA
jgi:hypothetical protein